MSAYADDLTVLLDGSEASLRRAATVFKDFREGTGLQLITEKTICTWIGSARQQRDPICLDLKLKWIQRGEPLDLLGVKIFPDAKRTREICNRKIERSYVTMDSAKFNSAR